MTTFLRCLCALLLASTASAAITPDAQVLIDRHVAWLGGWQSLDNLQDVTLEGTFAVAGLTGTLVLHERHDGRSRLDYDLTVFKGSECLAGEHGWECNPSGQIEDLGVDKALRLRRQNDRTFNRHLRGATFEPLDVTTAPTVEKEGRAWSVLRITYPDGDLYDLLLDPATGESAWSREVSDGRETWTQTSEVREVGGLRIAHRQETFAEHAAENQVVTWTRIAVNEGADDELFARPGASARLATIAGGVSSSEWQPIELYMDRYIYLRGAVNGIATDILLDSGAGITVLDRAFAERAGLQSAGAIAARGTGGTAEASMVEGITITVGDLTLGPVVAATIDLSELEKRFGRSMPVILGKELFHALVVDVDYPNARLRCHDPAAFAYDGPGHRLDLIAAEDGHKNVALSMEGGEPVMVGLDTGQGGALTVFGHYAEQRGFLTGRPLSSARTGGVGGETISTTGTLASVTIAGYALKDVPVTFHTDDVKGAFDTTRLAGNLGAGLLARFRVLFDYAHDAMWLEPGAHIDQPMARDRCGLSLERDGAQLVVKFVAPGSPAEAAGWQVDERVTALDGKPIDDAWWRATMAWAHAQDGATARFTMADGSERTIELRQYY